MPTDQTPAQGTAHESYAHNHATLRSIVLSCGRADTTGGRTYGLKLSLERFLVDHTTNTTVGYDGERGIEALLEKLLVVRPDLAPVRHERHLTGLTGSFSVLDGTKVGVAITLGAGGQIICEAGPSTSVPALMDAINEWDRQIHVASVALDCNYELLAEGYNPLVNSPLDIALVPRTSWGLLNAHLGQTGRYARDMMRCTAATRITLTYNTLNEKLEAFQVGTALTPVLMFLTDNVRSFRGSGARRCPRMARSIIWQEVDPARCGVVPGTFGSSFSLDGYLNWLEGIQPVYFVDALDTTSSTGKQTLREFMEKRVLSGNEALGLFGTVFPYVRVGHDLELLQADSLRPRYAAGYAALVKGLFCTKLSLDATRSAIGNIADEDVDIAAHELRMHAWDAKVYGRNVEDLVTELLQVARTTLDNAEERRVLDELAQLWEVNMVPRDAYVRQEIREERGW